jgi:hypothetical protein
MAELISPGDGYAQFAKWKQNIERQLRDLQSSPRVPSVTVSGGRLATFNPLGITVGVDNGANAHRNVSGFGDPTSGDPGPAVTLETAERALVIINATVRLNNTANLSCTVSYDISGATTSAADADVARYITKSFQGAAGTYLGDSIARVYVEEGLTPGENTFTMKYNTGGSSSVQFNDRTILVIPL